jgi:hypothetical protein
MAVRDNSICASDRLRKRFAKYPTAAGLAYENTRPTCEAADRDAYGFAAIFERSGLLKLRAKRLKSRQENGLSIGSTSLRCDRAARQS